MMNNATNFTIKNVVCINLDVKPVFCDFSLRKMSFPSKLLKDYGEKLLLEKKLRR